jgi:hypothetical protein
MKYYKIGESYGKLESGQILTTSQEVVYITKQEYEAVTGETVTQLTEDEISNLKREDYKNEVSDLLEQYTRLSLIGETEKLESILAEIKAITREIRERYDR